MKKTNLPLNELLTAILASAVAIGWLFLGLCAHKGYLFAGVLALLAALVWWLRVYRAAKKSG